MFSIPLAGLDVTEDLMWQQWSRLATRHLTTVLKPDLGTKNQLRSHIRCGTNINVSGIALSEILIAFTDLYLLLSKRDTADNVNSCSFVRLGITLVLGFKDRLIFGAAKVVSSTHNVFFFGWKKLPRTASFLSYKRQVINVWRCVLAHGVLRVDKECIAAFRAL